VGRNVLDEESRVLVSKRYLITRAGARVNDFWRNLRRNARR
jgi:hypothetical protein